MGSAMCAEALSVLSDKKKKVRLVSEKSLWKCGKK